MLFGSLGGYSRPPAPKPREDAALSVDSLSQEIGPPQSTGVPYDVLRGMDMATVLDGIGDGSEASGDSEAVSAVMRPITSVVTVTQGNLKDCLGHGLSDIPIVEGRLALADAPAFFSHNADNIVLAYSAHRGLTDGDAAAGAVGHALTKHIFPAVKERIGDHAVYQKDERAAGSVLLVGAGVTIIPAGALTLERVVPVAVAANQIADFGSGQYTRDGFQQYLFLSYLRTLRAIFEAVPSRTLVQMGLFGTGHFSGKLKDAVELSVQALKEAVQRILVQYPAFAERVRVNLVELDPAVVRRIQVEMRAPANASLKDVPAEINVRRDKCISFVGFKAMREMYQAMAVAYPKSGLESVFYRRHHETAVMEGRDFFNISRRLSADPVPGGHTDALLKLERFIKTCYPQKVTEYLAAAHASYTPAAAAT